MTRYVVLLLLSLCMAMDYAPKKKVAAAPTCGDDFNRANGALGANWTNNVQTITIASNGVTGTLNQDTLASFTAQNLGTDHYAQVTLTGLTGDNEGPCVRVSGTSGYCYYALGGAQTVRQLYRIVGGAWGTAPVSNTTPQTNVVGDILKLAVSGTGATVTLTMTRNGSLDTGLIAGGVYNDTAGTRIVTGNFAGMSIYSNNLTLDNFVCNTGS